MPVQAGAIAQTQSLLAGRNPTRSGTSGRHFLPAGSGIERRHLRADRGGTLAEILLVDPAVVVHDESHHAALAPLGRVRDHRETGDHPSIDDVTIASAGGALAFARQ